MKVKTILSFLLFLNIGLSIYQDPYNNYNIDIQQNTNRQIEVKFPYDQILSVKISNGSLPEFAEIIQNRFKIVTIIEEKLLPDRNLTLVDELRTPFSYQYSHIMRLNGSLIAFNHPNHFVFIQQNRKSFAIQQEYKLPEMLDTTSTILKIEDHFVLILLSIDELILLNETSLFKQQNVFNTTDELKIKQINFQNETYFITIVNQVLIIFSIENGVLNILSQTDLTEKNDQIQISSFLIGKVQENGAQIWFIDENKGLYFTVLNQNLTIKTSLTLIQSQQGCYDLDSKKDWHSFSILLTCLKEEYSTFKILLFDNDKFKIPFLLKTTEAHSQRSSANKFYFLKNYIYAQQGSSLDIFTQGLPNNEKDNFEKNWVKFNEFKTFFLEENKEGKQIWVYSVHKGVVSKKQLIQEAYTLSLYSSDPIDTVLTFTVSYLCEKGINRELQICESQMQVSINIHNNIVSYVQYKSINVAIILLLATTFVAVLLLCRYKYKSIYNKTYKEFKEISNPTKCQF